MAYDVTSSVMFRGYSYCDVIVDIGRGDDEMSNGERYIHAVWWGFDFAGRIMALTVLVGPVPISYSVDFRHHADLPSDVDLFTATFLCCLQHCFLGIMHRYAPHMRSISLVSPDMVRTSYLLSVFLLGSLAEYLCATTSVYRRMRSLRSQPCEKPRLALSTCLNAWHISRCSSCPYLCSSRTQ